LPVSASDEREGLGVRSKINFFVNLQLLWSERGGEEVNKNNE
jgi:hypothetical protein